MAKGFHQKESLDYVEIFSPVVKPATVRLVLSLALSKGWKVRQFDFNNAFLNGELAEEVFMVQPEGYQSETSHHACRLHKALYGLKQVPRAWFSKLSSTLIQFGFSATKCDSSLFTKFTAHSTTYILVYVDDLLITGDDATYISSLITNLNTIFALKDLGEMNYFLGIQVHHTSSTKLVLTQTKYIQDLLKKAGMEHAKGIPTPMVSGQKLSKFDDAVFSDPSLYRSIVGGLQYTTITRPDVAFAVNKVSQFMQQPLDIHWKAVKRILRYLAGTSTHGLKFHKSNDFRILAFCDSDWGSDVDDRKSTSGHCVFFGSNLISWSSKKQSVVSRSSTEAEFRSLASVLTDISWLQSLLTELHVPCFAPPSVFCDNQGAVLLAANPILHSKTKHFELDLYFVHDKVANKEVFVSHVPAHEQIADILTKSVSPQQFLTFRPKLRVLESSHTEFAGG